MSDDFDTCKYRLICFVGVLCLQAWVAKPELYRFRLKISINLGVACLEN